MTARRWTAFVVALVAACAGVVAVSGPSTLTGTPLPAMTVPAPNSLTTGVFATTPDHDTWLEPRTRSEALRAESRRLLGYLVSPAEVDPEISILDRTEVLGDAEQDDSGEFSLALGEFRPAAARLRFLYGVLTARDSYLQEGSFAPRHRKSILITLLRFPDAAAARDAAADFTETAAALSPGGDRIPVPGTEATMLLVTAVHAELFTAHGDIVIGTRLGLSDDGPAQLLDYTRRILDRQFALLDTYTPTPAEDIPALPEFADPLLDHALPTGNGLFGSFGPSLTGTYSAAAHRHLERDSTLAASAAAAAGVDRVAHYGGTVYRTRDLASAFRWQRALTGVGRYDEPLPGPPGLVDARCLRSRTPVAGGGRALCAVVFGRYVAVVALWSAEPETDPTLYQSAAAQYTRLATLR